ncbi:MAG: ASCH domain-containing protein [Nanoarchaeota archaeon]|nr:ASCH domain-containing protein [Nanoarchaeota archaeon]
MKALSLKQPYAELVISGKKTIELRKWKTKFRGEFLVHASQTIDKEAMQRFGFKELPTGCILGKATLTEVKHYTNEKEHRKDQEQHLANTTWGNYGFILMNIQRFKQPLPAKGKLNFWEYEGKIPLP